MACNKREVAVVVAVAVLACMAAAEAAITCGTVSGSLSSCLPYMTQTSVMAPSGACCGGVNKLFTATKASRPDRVTSCGCIKNLANQLGPKLNAARVSALPGKCGVNLGYSISTSTNCAGIP